MPEVAVPTIPKNEVRKLLKVAIAFAHGGVVSAHEADTYCRLTEGTVKAECEAGKLRYEARRAQGNTIRYMVNTSDVVRLHPIARAR